MRAVLPAQPGDDGVPRLGEVEDPVAGPGEVVLSVRATAINRADLLQLRGQYPPPAGESDVPGLEAAGEVTKVGPGVEGWRTGDAATALLAGGGHAERVAVPAGQLLPVPGGWSFEEAAALPEAALTAWTNLVAEGALAADQAVLISGASGGVGTFAVQLARELGARVFVAGREPERLEALRALGAEGIFALADDLPTRLRAATDGRGADLVLDLVGGVHLGRLLASLRPRGRLVLVGLVAGRRAEIDLGLVLSRRLVLVGSVLRSRSRVEKAHLVAGFLAFAAPLLAARRLLPVIERVHGFERIAEAYAQMERGRPFGKVLVRVPR